MSSVNKMQNLLVEVECLINEDLASMFNSNEYCFFLQKRVPMKLLSVYDQKNKFVLLIACDELHALIFDPDEEDFGLGHFFGEEFLSNIELVGPFLACAREFYRRRRVA